MFDLKVVSLEEADILIEDNWPTRIVGLTAESRPSHGPHHLHVQVDDVSFDAHWAIRPSPEHLQTVLEFTEDLTDDDRLLVHCFAGMSRSTAIAIGILIQHGMDYLEAFEHVAKVRSILLPNQLFIQHIDDHFGLHGDLVKLVADHRVETFEKNFVQSAPSQKDVDAMKHLLGLFRS